MKTYGLKSSIEIVIKTSFLDSDGNLNQNAPIVFRKILTGDKLNQSIAKRNDPYNVLIAIFLEYVAEKFRNNEVRKHYETI